MENLPLQGKTGRSFGRYHRPELYVLRRGLGERLRRVGLSDRERERGRAAGLSARVRVGLLLLLDMPWNKPTTSVNVRGATKWGIKSTKHKRALQKREENDKI